MTQLVYLEWVDSTGQQGWHKIDAIRNDAEPCLVKSVGWLIVETPEVLTLSAHLTIDEAGKALQGCDPMSIPASLVRKRVDLPEPAQQEVA